MSENWLDMLREAARGKGGQKAVAARLGYSAAVISAVLKGTYKGNCNSVRQKVEGVLMGRTVECPVVGDLPRDRCMDYQRQEFAATNHLRVRLARTCPTCPHRLGDKP